MKKMIFAVMAASHLFIAARWINVTAYMKSVDDSNSEIEIFDDNFFIRDKFNMIIPTKSYVTNENIRCELICHDDKRVQINLYEGYRHFYMHDTQFNSDEPFHIIEFSFKETRKKFKLVFEYVEEENGLQSSVTGFFNSFFIQLLEKNELTEDGVAAGLRAEEISDFIHKDLMEGYFMPLNEDDCQKNREKIKKNPLMQKGAFVLDGEELNVLDLMVLALRGMNTFINESFYRLRVYKEFRKYIKMDIIRKDLHMFSLSTQMLQRVISNLQYAGFEINASLELQKSSESFVIGSLYSNIEGQQKSNMIIGFGKSKVNEITEKFNTIIPINS